MAVSALGALDEALILIDRKRNNSSRRLRDYYVLTKPEVNLLILMTTSAGYYLASRGPCRIAGLMNTLLGMLLVASGTATLNQWMERVLDGQIRRTARRPLPSGRLDARKAFLFGIFAEHRRRPVPRGCS